MKTKTLPFNYIFPNLITSFKKRSLAFFVGFFVFLVGMIPINSFAAAVTPPTNGQNICSLTAQSGSSPSYTTLNTITVTEGANSDFQFTNGGSPITLTLTAPNGWRFNTSSSPSYNILAGSNITSVTSGGPLTSTTLTITVSGKQQSGTLDAFTIVGLQVQATNTTSANGNITANSASGFTGITTGSAGTSFATLSLQAAVTPSVTIAASPVGTICTNTSVTFTPTPTNGGTPTYQWKLNGNNVSTGATYTNSSWTNNDQVSVVMTTSVGCVTQTTATSNVVTMAVNNPAAPTGNASQIFCAINNPAVANLLATGTGIQWYSAATGGTALASTTALVNGTHYYASQTVSGCEGTSRLDVTATVSNPAAPTGNASQIFCAINNPTVANLIATGTGIQWYSAATGGTALASTTALVNGTHYYASQTVSGCEGTSRLDVTATVSNPAAPTGNASQIFCAINNPAVANLLATGTGIQWYSAATGGTALASTTALVNGTHYYASQTVSGCEGTSRLDVTATVSNPAAPTGNASQIFCAINNPTVANLLATGTGIQWYSAATGGTALASTTALVNGTHYYASQTVTGCEGTSRLDVTATVSNPAAPTGNSAQIFCAINNPTIANLTATGTGIQWYSAATGGTALASTTALVNGTHYYASQTVTGCEGTSRLDVTATVSNPAAPTGNSAQIFCAINNPTIANLTATGTGIQWYSAATGGTALASTTALVNGTHYYASQTVTGCEGTSRLDVTATVSNPAAPTGNSAQIFCAINNPTIANLTATGTGIQWYSAATGGTALASTTALVNGTHYYASQTVSGCEGTSRLDVTGLVNNPPAISTHPTSQTVCSNTSASFTVAASGTGPLTYAWYKGSTLLTDGPRVAGATTSTLTLSLLNAGSSGDYSVSVSDASGCAEVKSNAATLTVNQEIKITSQPAVTQTLCEGSNVIFNVKAEGTGPFSVEWYKGTTLINISPKYAVAENVDETTDPPTYTTSLTINSIIPGDDSNNNYYAIIRNSTEVCHNEVSNAAALVVNPLPTVTTSASSVTCSGASPNIALTSSVPSTFSWTVGTITGGITGASAGTGNTINQVLNNPDNTSAGTVQYIVTPTSTTGSCSGSPYSITVSVNPTTTVTSAANGSVCNNVAQNYAITSSAIGTVSYSWSRSAVTGISNGAVSAQTSNPITETLVNTTNSAVNVVYSITPIINGCAGTPFTYTVSVNPTTTVTSAANGSVCNNVAQNYAITSSAIGTVSYSWSRSAVTGISNGAVSAQTSNPITETLVNTTNSAVNVVYSITPIINGCAGTPFTYTVSVNPTTTVMSAANGSVCNNVAQNYAITSSAIGTVSYSWSRSAVTGISNGAVSAQTSNPITETLVNTTNSAVNVVYSITPIINGCAGTPFTYTVSVNPTTTVMSAANGSVCNNVAQNYAITSSAIGTVSYSWSRSAVTGINNNTSISGQTSNPITETLTNATNSAINVVYTITPIINGCAGTPFTYTVRVNPTATVTSAAGGSVCNGVAQNYTITSSATGAVTYSWSRAAVTGINNNTSISGQTSNPITETLTNATNSAINVVYTITPIINGCAGTPFTYTVSVNPTATVTSAALGSVCNGVAQNYTITSSATGTVTYSWSRAAVTGINNNTSISGQTSNPITETLTNATNSAINVVYTITPIINGCAGTPFTYTVSVNPTATVTSAALGSVCNGVAQNYTITSSATGTVTYSWSRAAVTGINNNTSISGQTSNPITETLTNATNSAINVVYTITPIVNGCAGTPFTYTVSVNPTATVTSAAGGSVCNGVAQNYTITSSATGAVTYSWSRAAVTGINNNTSISGQTSNPITETLTNATNSAINVVYTITPIVNGCAGTPFTYTVSVSPTAVGGTLSPALVTGCTGTTSGTITLAGQTGTVVGWEKSTDGGATWVSTLNNNQNPLSLTYSNLTQTTSYRALLSTGVACSNTYSSISVVSVVPKNDPTTLATLPAICVGQNSLLSSTTGYSTSGISASSGNFNNANPPGWLVEGIEKISANANTTDPGPWNETSSKLFNGITYAGDLKFAIVNGAFNSILETPVFSLIGENTIALNFVQAYSLISPAVGKIEISTDGGVTYKNVLAQYNGTTSLGVSGSNATMQNTSISLANYIGLSNLRIRFNYSGSSNSSWAIDNVAVPASLPITYVWSDPSSPTTLLTDPTKDTVRVQPTGTTTYTLTTSVAGCVVGTSTVKVTVNPLPTITPAAGTGGVVSVCFSTSAQTASLPYTATNNPTTYSIVWSQAAQNAGFKNVTNTALTPSPVNVSVPAGASPATYTATITVNNANGCSSGSADFSVVVNPLPVAYTVTGGGGYCTGGTGVNIGLSASQTGVNYQLYNGINPVGTAVPGTGSAIGFGLQTAAGTYKVVATNGSTGCLQNMSNTVVVTINLLPAQYNVTPVGGSSYCAGGTGVSIGLSGSQVGVNYQLLNNGSAVGTVVSGTGSVISFGNQTAAGNYTVVATNATTACTKIMSGNAALTVNPLPTVYNVTGGGAYCAGGSGVSIGLSGSDNGVNYQLFNGTTAVGTAVPGTGSPISFGLQAAAGTYKVVATNASTTCPQNMSNTVAITINPLPTQYTVTPAGGGSYCAGGTGVAIGLSGSEIGVNYQLFNATTAVGSAVQGTGSALNFGLQTTAGTYKVVATNAITNCPQNMSGSAVITINPLPTVYNVTGGGAYCAGGSGVTIGLSGSNNGVNYQLVLNSSSNIGSPILGTGSAINFPNQTVAGTYTVVATASGCPNNMSGTATVTVINAPTTTNPQSQSVCVAGNTTFTVTATGATTYQWQVSTNGGTSFSNIGDDALYSGTATTSLQITNVTKPMSGYQYRIVVSGSSTCASATSVAATLTVPNNDWIGVTNVNWNVGTNWACGRMPFATEDALIPPLSASVIYQPTLTTATFITNLTLQAGSVVTLNGQIFNINGDVNQTGQFLSDANASIVLGGAGNGTLYFAQGTDSITNVIKDLTVNTTGTFIIGNPLYILNELVPKQGTLNANGNLTIRSTSVTATARVAEAGATATVKGDVTVERFIPAKRAFRLLSPSVTTTTSINKNWMEGVVSPSYWSGNVNPKPGYGTHITGNHGVIDSLDYNATSYSSLFYYDNGRQAWDSAKNSFSTLKAGVPWRVLVRGSRSVDLSNNEATPSNTIIRAKGTLKTGDVVYDASGANGPVISSAPNGWSLVGNPYASSIDWNKIFSASKDITPSYTVWDPMVRTRGAYVTFNALQGLTGNDTSNVDNNIQAGQGFFIQTAGTSPKLTFQESYKTTSRTQVFRIASERPKLSVQLLLNEKGGIENTADGFTAVFDEHFKTDIGDEDSYKFTNLDENIGIASGGSTLSIEGRPMIKGTDTIQLKMWQFRQTSYFLKVNTINFDRGITAFVKDAYLQVETPINLNDRTNIPFNLTSDAASSASNRFTIVFKASKALPVVVTDIKASLKDKAVRVEWTSHTETNIDRYEIERSEDAQNFVRQGVVSAKGNNSTTQLYEWLDQSPVTGTNFYRIKVIEKSGEVKYTAVVKVDIAKTAGSITVYPNPVRGNKFSINMKNMEKGRYIVMLYNNAGQSVFSTIINHDGRNAAYPVTTRVISKGSYQLHISNDNIKKTELLIFE